MAGHLSERDDLTLRTLAFIERTTVAEQRRHALREYAARGDFTPYEAPEYVKEKLSPLGQLAEHLAEVLSMDHILMIADCGMEAGG